MRNGAGYYESAVKEARKHGYSLRPFVTVRLPTLAWFISSMPNETFGWGVLMVLALVTLCAWSWRLRAIHSTRPQYAVAIIGLTTGMFPALALDFAMYHETWAGILIALSLAVRRRDAWVASVAIGLAAALTRELAGAYLLAMAAMALRDRNYREMVAWFATIAALALALAIHAMHVNTLVAPDDLVSPGWLTLDGWTFVLNTAHWNNVVLAWSPYWVSAIVFPFALFGLTASQTSRGLLLIIGGYVAAFFVVGRSDNFYWGLLIAPLWPLGLSGTWSALTEHLSAIRLGTDDAKTAAAWRRNGDTCVVAEIETAQGNRRTGEGHSSECTPLHS